MSQYFSVLSKNKQERARLLKHDTNKQCLILNGGGETPEDCSESNVFT